MCGPAGILSPIESIATKTEEESEVFNKSKPNVLRGLSREGNYVWDDIMG
jgi:hypothetical protein